MCIAPLAKNIIIYIKNVKALANTLGYLVAFLDVISVAFLDVISG